MNDFLPEGYSVPKQGGNYFKFKDGSNRFRVLASPVIGYMYWNRENKPVRIRKQPAGLPLDIRENEDGTFDRVKHFWAVPVWNYAESAVQILEITQATIQAAITDLVSSEEWGNPREFDITVNRKGEKLNTEYTVQPSPHKPIDEKIKAEFENKKLNLDALFEGGDPFAAVNTVAEQKADKEFSTVTKQEPPEVVKKQNPPADIPFD
jgi:hypothetical protein